MIFNPISKRLYTNSRKFLKKLECPIKADWDNFASTDDSITRICQHCDRSVIDTEYLSEPELLKVLLHEKATCLKVDINQENIIIDTLI